MICPRCQTRLSDDAAICDECNYIIDAGFLGSDITNEEGAPSKADSTRVRDVKPDVPEPPPVAAKATAAEDEPKGPGRLERLAAPHASVSEAADDIRDQFQSFPLAERLATGGAAAFLISLGLPWRYTPADEDAIGLFAGALPLGLVATVVCVAAFIRRGPLRKYTEEVLVMSLAAATVTVGGTAVFFSRSFERSWVSMAGRPPAQVWKVLPHMGLYIALVAAILMLIGTAATYRERIRSRS